MMRYRDTRAIARVVHRYPSIRAPSLDRDRREWGTRARGDWRRALAPTEISARGSLAWDQVAHRRSDAWGPCIPSRRVTSRLRSALFLSQRPFNHRNGRLSPLERILKLNERDSDSRTTRGCARKLPENVPYYTSCSKGRAGQGRKRKRKRRIRRRKKDARARAAAIRWRESSDVFGSPRHPSGSASPFAVRAEEIGIVDAWHSRGSFRLYVCECVCMRVCVSVLRARGRAPSLLLGGNGHALSDSSSYDI